MNRFFQLCFLLTMPVLLISSLDVCATNPALEHAKLQRPSDAVGGLGNDIFGEQVDFYTGATQFAITDINLPGNNSLPVSLTRRFAVSEYDAFTSVSNIFGNWEVDIPKMSGTFAQGHGWTVASSSPQSRCSSPAGDVLKARPPKVYVGATPFFALEYWHGYMMTIPGQGTSEMLVNHGQNPQPSQGGPYPWTTKGNWRITCLPSITGGSGEGFLAVAPNGTKYFFNRMVVSGTGENASELSKPYEFATAEVNSPKCPSEHGSFQYNYIDHRNEWYPPAQVDGGGGGSDSGEGRCIGTTYVTNIITYVNLNRIKVEMLATRVEDRFGNWVNYNYDASGRLLVINSNDGRNISLAYGINGALSSATANGNTWSYAYTNGIINGTSTATPLLSTATRPDGSSWTYQYEGGIYHQPLNTETGSYCLKSDRGGLSPPFTLRAKHPSGAAGEFYFQRIVHELTNVPYACDIVSEGEVPLEKATLWYPRQIANYGIKSKKTSGAGVPESIWTYNYLPAVGGFAPTGFTNPLTPDCEKRVCDASKSIEVTAPDATITRYQFGIEYQKTEGQLQKVELRRGDKVFRTDIYTYVDDANAQGYAALAGISPQPRANMLLSNSIAPQKKRTTLQDGVVFENTVETFDAFAAPTKVLSNSSLGYSRTDTTTYEQNLAKWVVGLPKTTTNNDTGKVVSQVNYDANTSLPISTYSFGLLNNTLSYHADGNVHGVADAASKLTRMGDYHRGIPRSVIFADNTTIAAQVNSDGTVASTTDQLISNMQYQYDVMGRLSAISYPGNDIQAWNPVSLSFIPVNVIEHGLPAGHWRQSIYHGNKHTNNYLDAFWRPVMTEELDATDIGNTVRQTIHKYDSMGRKIFQSYPVAWVDDFNTANTGVRTEYDALGRVTKVIQDSEHGPLTTTTEYLKGFKVRVTDPKGNQTITSYQVFGEPDNSRPTLIQQPLGTTTTIVRDIFGKPLSTTRSGPAQ